MKKKKSPTNDRELTDAIDQKGGGQRQRSRASMANDYRVFFVHLNINLTNTILHPKTDKTEGAAKFAELMIAFLEIKRPAGESPKFIWLAPELEQLGHVFRYMRDHEKKELNDAFNELINYTTIAVRDPSSPYNKMLADMAQSGEALTASPTSEGNFSYLKHSSPSSDDDWQGGPLCEPLTNVPDELNELSQNLLKAHGEKLSGRSGTAMEHLRKSKISISTIRDILPVFALCILHAKNVAVFGLA